MKDENLVRWKCAAYQTKGCRARITTINGKIAAETNAHNHVADVAGIQAERVVSDIRDRALASRDKPRYASVFSLL